MINDLNPQKWEQLFDSVDLSGATPALKPENSFSATQNPGVDLTIPPISSTTETTTQAPVVTPSTVLEDVDLTGNEEEIIEEGATPAEGTKPGRKPKYAFQDTVGYFEDRIKAGKFVALEEEVNGQTQTFIPKTPEEFDEFFETQVNYHLEQKRQENDKTWYESKSPAWKAVAQYAEMSDDPSELLPFIQGVQAIASVSEVDETTPEGAEQIVRTRLQQRGDTEDVIAETLEALKGAGKLETQAAKFKPLILQGEQQNLQRMMEEKQQQEQQYYKTITEIRDNAIKAIEEPLYGKKLKMEEKALVYELIGEPNPTTQGYQIYTEIDQLFEKKDFETLRQLSLLIKKKEAFLNDYVKTAEANRVAEGVQRKLRVATDGRTVGNNGVIEEPTQQRSVKRSTYKAPNVGGFRK
jgi:hypothetical protein